MNLTPKDPKFEERIRKSFVRQVIMDTFGASLANVSAGAVEIRLPYNKSLTQQHGFLHAGAVATILDSACGYAALTLAEAGDGVLAVEYKINFLSPAVGDEIVARGNVTRAGTTVTVCTGDAFSIKDGVEKIVAKMLATMMIVTGRGLTD